MFSYFLNSCCFLALGAPLIDPCHSSNYCNVRCIRYSGCSYLLKPQLIGFLLLLEYYLPAVPLRGRGGWGALVDRCGGLDWHRTPLLRAYGAAVGASLVLMMVRHGGHQSAPWTSLSTEPHRSGTSSDTLTARRTSETQKSESHTISLTYLSSLYEDRKEHLGLFKAFYNHPSSISVC